MSVEIWKLVPVSPRFFSAAGGAAAEQCVVCETEVFNYSTIMNQIYKTISLNFGFSDFALQECGPLDCESEMPFRPCSNRGSPQRL